MIFSISGRHALECEEGCRLRAYRDTRGIPTIGYGHTLGVRLGMTWTMEQADEQFEHDLSLYIASVFRDLKRPVRQNQFDAFVSLAYNIGMGGFARSEVVKDFNLGKPDTKVAQDFLLWAHPPELLDRRKREAVMFLRGVYRNE